MVPLGQHGHLTSIKLALHYNVSLLHPLKLPHYVCSQRISIHTQQQLFTQTLYLPYRVSTPTSPIETVSAVGKLSNTPTGHIGKLSTTP
ncbi:3446_t:CDS:1, partial [Ambispora gerdemannii]